ncbi:MAG: GNAT family N-acetyltransferase [Candidatus Latescibacteria bacterium]|nr:GNAT family N-acetyltransferase [Candidatus Latescibacterota bacterium]
MFYNTMYVPFIRRRHGKRAAVRNVYWLRRCFHQGGILWVLHGGRRIAGVFFQQWGQTLHLLALGTANGEWAPVKAGAIAALYYYSVEHARDLGCKTVDFGGSRPALTDGVLCYKRKWGMRLVEKRGSSYDFLVHWAYMDKPVTAFLAHTPLIFRDRGGLSAVAAIDGEGPVVLTEAWTIHHTMWIPGLRRLSLVAASGWESDNDAPPQTRLIDLTTVGDCDPRMLLAWTTDLRRSVRLRGLGPIGVIGREQRFDRLYWDHVVEEIRRGVSLCVWRAYMRRVYQRLVWDWLPAPEVGRGLKTDLFEEAVTSHHLLPDLGPGSVGVDSSLTVVRAARKRLGGAGEPCLFIVGDLRRLPLRSGCVMRILAGSSLDHFPERRDIAVSLAELARVLAAGGTLVITFDNPHNPIVWLRNWLPFAWLNRLRLVPYYVGATYGRTEARAQLEAFGLVVTNEGTVAHTPRAPAIWLVALVERLRWGRLETLMARILDGFETLERWPTRYRTGYYLTLRAEKRQLANDG